MLTQADVDATTFWLAAALLADEAHEADQLALEQLRDESRKRPLAEVTRDLDRTYREQPGEFGIDQAAQFVLPLLLPAVYEFVKWFAAKFVEGAASEAGKVSLQALKTAMTTPASAPDGVQLKPEVWAGIERELAERARQLNLPTSSYKGLVEQLRANPQLLL